MSTLARRLVTVPMYVGLFLLAVASLPVVLPAALLADLLRRSDFALTRAFLFFAWYLGCEVVGIAGSAASWLAHLFEADGRSDVDRLFRLQWWWSRSLFAGARRIFGLGLEVEGAEDVGGGPMLLFMRHASIGDTVLPATVLSSGRGLRLRYVLKRELLWDPCIDLVGNRLPNYFVRRGSDDGPREIDAVRRLAEGIGPGEGILIYPEGTRFTEGKRARILERLERLGSADLANRARSLRNVLPPRLGGPLALLEACPGVDAVFCAHVGFEGSTRFSEFLGGGLVRSVVRVAFWRIPAGQIPVDRDERIDWLFAQWDRMDAWVSAHLKERR